MLWSEQALREEGVGLGGAGFEASLTGLDEAHFFVTGALENIKKDGFTRRMNKFGHLKKRNDRSRRLQFAIYLP